jgi:hypothetical protein
VTTALFPLFSLTNLPSLASLAFLGQLSLLQDLPLGQLTPAQQPPQLCLFSVSLCSSPHLDLQLTELQMALPATPNVDSYLTTLNQLDIPDGTATGKQLNLFLGLLQHAADQYKVETPAAKQLIVFSKEVAYMDATHRGNIIAQARNALINNGEEGAEERDEAAEEEGEKDEGEEEEEEEEEQDEEQNEKEAWKAEMQLWGTCQEAVFACKATAINLFLVASHPNLVWENTWTYRFGGQKNNAQAKKQHYDRLADWHAYAVKIQDRQAWIYDGSYVAPAGQGSVRRRLHQLPFMKRAWDLIKAYRGKKLKVDRIFVGGGGNDSGVCQDMACHWMRSEVMHYMGRLDSAVPVEEWEEVSL